MQQQGMRMQRTNGRWWTRLHLAKEQPEPAVVQELRQLEAQLQSLQQERDRVAVAYAASQQVALEAM